MILLTVLALITPVFLLKCGTPEDSLLDFFTATGGVSSWHENNWFQTPDYCDWTGIGCNAQGEITTIALDFFNLTGSLPSSIGCFPALMALSLAGNALLSEFPRAVCELRALEALALPYARLFGPIPDCVCGLSALRSVRLSGNFLSGALPLCVARLAQLEEFVAPCNLLSGAVPRGFGEIASLGVLELLCNGGVDCASFDAGDVVFGCGDVAACAACWAEFDACPDALAVSGCGTYLRGCPASVDVDGCGAYIRLLTAGG